MSREVSQSLSLSFEAPTVRIAELYDVALRDGTTYYFTSHQVSLVWNGNTYTPLPITRDPIRFGINMEMDAVKVYLANISGALAEYVQANGLDQAEVTIRQIVRGSTYAADNEVLLFKGHADVDYDRTVLTLTLRPWLDSLNLQVPRCTYQEPCNWSIFDDNCGLATADLSFSGSVASGTTVRLNYPDGLPTTTGFADRANWVGGEVYVRTGNNAGQRRPIRAIAASYLEVMWPFPTPLSYGNEFTLYPGCDGRVETCTSYGNDEHIRAYLYIPRYEETMF